MEKMTKTRTACSVQTGTDNEKRRRRKCAQCSKCFTFRPDERFCTSDCRTLSNTQALSEYLQTVLNPLP
jgi:hypothetical protein